MEVQKFDWGQTVYWKKLSGSWAEGKVIDWRWTSSEGWLYILQDLVTGLEIQRSEYELSDRPNL